MDNVCDHGGHKRGRIRATRGENNYSLLEISIVSILRSQITCLGTQSKIRFCKYSQSFEIKVSI